jgi:hypothetical protein
VTSRAHTSYGKMSGEMLEPEHLAVRSNGRVKPRYLLSPARSDAGLMPT